MSDDGNGPLGETITTLALVDGGVLADMSSALSGGWYPTDEADVTQRALLVAAARLRLYARRDRCGWTLTTTSEAREEVLGAQADADWAAGVIPLVDNFVDAPPEGDLEALIAVYREEESLDEVQADVLAHAVLYRQIDVVISRTPRSYRHNREHDLPTGLEIIDPVEAVRRLAIADGEVPVANPPAGSLLSMSEPWWIPAPEVDW